MSKLDALLRTVADEQDELRAKSGNAERVAQRIQRSAPRSRRRVRAWTALAAALGFALSFLALEALRSAPLAIDVGGRTPLVGAWLGAPDASALPLEFSDGSRFELAPRSKARVVEIERASARVELASGSMHVHVIPRGSGQWRIDAGPFGVHVTGTRFVVSYVPEDDVLEVSMEEGQVELTGCVFGAGRKLSALQRVRASCRTRELEVGDRNLELVRTEPARAAIAPARDEATSPLAASTAATQNGSAPKGAASGAAKSAGTSWVALARTGKYQDAYATAEREGFDAECQRAAAEDLTLLADVARHARAPRQAKQALLVLRRRFAGGGEASTAAFALGRLEFDEFRAYSAAAEWFRTYLSERPGGPMAREALGRLIEAYQRAGDLAGAESTARRYLRDYPSGPHAELASRLVQAP